MPSVLQDWVHGLTFMQQTVLLTAVRGPDNVDKYDNVKYLVRWFRRCVLRSSLDGGMTIDNPWRDDVGGSFMGQSIIGHFYAGDVTKTPFCFYAIGEVQEIYNTAYDT